MKHRGLSIIEIYTDLGEKKQSPAFARTSFQLKLDLNRAASELEGLLKNIVFISVLARPERLELPTLWFEARCSIQLSYGRAKWIITLSIAFCTPMQA